MITPIRAVAAKLRDRVGRLQLGRGRGRIGTIRTFQGKEADVVFLVPGTDAPAVGSRQWAGSKPNLLNVAVTRARGRARHRRPWAETPYFAILADKVKDSGSEGSG